MASGRGRGGKAAGRIRHERFAHEWLKDFNATAAYKRAGYTATGNAAHVNAARTLKHPDVQRVIRTQQRRRLAHIDITADRMLQETAQVAVATPADPVKYADKLRALELLLKHLGLMKDQPPPAQWNLDPATLGKMSTKELETALKHAEMVHRILAGKPTP